MSASDGSGGLEPTRKHGLSTPSVLKERFFKRDHGRFSKFIKSTPTHGVVHIFTGKSKIRRVFWLIIVLGAAAGCLVTVINSILFLVSRPTSTTLSVSRQGSLNFPAVTVCNLNLIRRSYLESMHLADAVREILNLEPGESGFNESECNDSLNAVLEETLGSNVSIDFNTVTFEGRHFLELFVVDCTFQGVKCRDLPFDPWTGTFTRLGFCYAFNSGEEDRILGVNGTGTTHSLQLIMNIQQDEYISSSSGDAGVKLSIQPQGTPGEPDDIGIAVPPGRNAFIGVRERRIDDKSGSNDCKDASETKTFNFIASEYDYSITACIKDCFLSKIAETCGCVESSLFSLFSDYVGTYSSLPTCGEEQLCCLFEAFRSAHGCGTICPSSCTYTEYTASVSYSSYPAKYLVEPLISQIESIINGSGNGTTGADNLYSIFENVTIDREYIEDNILSVNVYFEDLNLEEQVTENAYSVTALLSDIGGQLGLFIGASVISLIEFWLWVLDELKDRCCPISERRMFSWLKGRKRKVTLNTDIELGKDDRHELP